MNFHQKNGDDNKQRFDDFGHNMSKYPRIPQLILPDWQTVGADAF